MMQLTTIRAALVAAALAQVAQYPQYCEAHFRAYRVARVTRDITTKMGLAFAAGEIVLVDTTPNEHRRLTFCTAWSYRNRCDTSIPSAAVEVLS